MELICGVPGAGKTERAVAMAKEDTGKTLYLSFSSENTKNSLARFDGLATCVSIHAFARRLLKVPKARICEQWDKTQLNHLNQLGIIDLPTSLSHSFFDFFSAFITSDTPIFRARALLTQRKFTLISEHDKALILSTLLKTWDAMWTKDSQIQVTHDMYLKRATESLGEIPYSLVLVDEAQDLNESMMSFVEAIEQKNPKCRVVLMADRSQQIFGYRGVSKKLNHMIPSEELTETRRFGKNVAHLLNCFMKKQSLSYHTEITNSFASDTEIMETPGWTKLFTEALHGRKFTVITRLNMSIWLLTKHLVNMGICFAVKGSPLSDIASLELIFGHYKDSLNKNCTGERKYRYQRYKDRAYSTNDVDSITACKLIESINASDNDFFVRLRKFLVDEKSAKILLTNIHQAKGLQFNDVVIAGDFQPCIEIHTGKAFKIPDEEAHVIYTAISRCRKRLTLPKEWIVFYNGLK